MNWLDFIASIVSSATNLAWPAAVVVSVWLLRANLVPLLPRLRIKHKDTTISFLLDEVEKEAEGTLPDASPENEPSPTASRFNRLAAISPLAAILELRTRFEEGFRSAARMYTPQIQNQDRLTTGRLLSELVERGTIPPDAASVIRELITLGNAAAHGRSEVSFEDAMRFQELSERAISTLREPNSK